MPHQLMAAGAGDTLDQHHVGGGLEDGAVLLAKNVPEIVRSAPARRIGLAHVAEPSGEFSQPLSVGRLTLPLDWKVLGLQELRPSDKSDSGVAEDVHGSLESGAWSREFGYRLQSYTSIRNFLSKHQDFSSILLAPSSQPNRAVTAHTHRCARSRGVSIRRLQESVPPEIQP